MQPSGSSPRTSICNRHLFIFIALAFIVAVSASLIVFTDESDAGSQFTVDGINYEAMNESTVKIVEGNYTGTVSIPSTVTYDNKEYVVVSIGDRAFADCSGLGTISIPASITSIGNDAFGGSHELMDINVSEDSTVFSSDDGILFDKEKTELIKYPEGRSDDTYDIPVTVDSIGAKAFYCSKLQYITVPSNVKTIGDYAFSCANDLKMIDISEDTSDIGTGAFTLGTEENQVTCYAVGCTDGYLDTSADRNTVFLYGYHKVSYDENGGSEIVQFDLAKGAYELKDYTGVRTGCEFKGWTDGSALYPAGSEMDIGKDVTFCAVWERTDGKTVSGLTVENIELTYQILREPAGTLPGTVSLKSAPTDKSCSLTIPTSIDTGSCNYTVISIGESALRECYFNTIIIPSTIQSIGQYSFSYCRSLLYIEIPDSVKTLGDHAFEGCSSLKTAKLPYAMPTIGESAFRYCASLYSVELPWEVKEIGNYAFSDCSSLKEISMVDNILSVGEYAFSKCTSLTSAYTILSATVAVGGHAFDGCVSIKSAEITYSLALGCGAFSGCTSLASVTIGYYISTLEDYTFSGCSSLMTITIPSNVTTIRSHVFEGCTSLIVISLHNGISEIGDSAFALGTSDKQVKCYALECADGSLNKYKNEYTEFKYGFHAVAYDQNGGSETVKTELAKDGYVIKNYSGTKDNCTFIGWTDGNEIYSPGSRITVTENITLFAVWERTDSSIFGAVNEDNIKFYYRIGREPAGSLHGTASLISPDSLTVSGTLRIPNTVVNKNYNLFDEYDVTTIGSKAFSQLSAIYGIVLPDSVTAIEDHAFKGSPIISITFGSNVESIGSNAFSGCALLTSVTIPDKVTSVSDYTFYNCVLLSSIVLGNNMKDIGDYAFYGCLALKSVSIPDSVESIGTKAFNECISLTSVTIPKNVTLIGSSAFNGCISLTGFTVAEENQYYCSNDGILFTEDMSSLIQYPAKKTDVAEYAVPNGVTTIETLAFGACGSLIKIIIPSSVNKIGETAFSGCTSLKEIEVDGNNGSYCSDAGVLYDKGKTKLIQYPADRSGSTFTIPKTVTAIDDMAFRGCTALTTVDIHKDVISIGELAFNGCTSLKYVKLNNAVPSIGIYAFALGNQDNYVTCYAVDCTSEGMLDSYKNAYTTFIYDSYTVTYDSNGGSVSLESDYVVGEYTLKDYSGTRTGYKYVGWTDGTELYSAGTTLDITADTTFYAVWERTDYRIIIVKSGDIDATYEIKREYVAGFHGTAYLTSVATMLTEGALVIPTTVTSENNIYDVIAIGDNATAFSCDKLTSVSIPETVTSIGVAAFSGCKLIESIVIPRGVSIINEDTFKGCSKLNSVNIPDTVCKIDKNAFYGCTSLVKLEIPDSVTEFGGGVFMKCTGLKTVNIPCNLAIISDSAFEGCTSLVSIDFPESVTDIGGYAFSGCTSLTALKFPDMNKVGIYAFQGCISVRSIYVSSFKTLDTLSFALGDSDHHVTCYALNCDEGYLDHYTDKNTEFRYDYYVVSYDTNGGTGTVESEFGKDGYNLKNYDGTKADCRFIGWTDGARLYNVGSCVDVNEDMTFFAVWERTDEQTFTSQTKEEIELTYQIKREPAGGLNGTVSLRSVPNDVSGTLTIPGTVTNEAYTYEVCAISDSACSGRTSLTAISVCSNVRTIGDNAFSGCTNLIFALISGDTPASLEKTEEICHQFDDCSDDLKIMVMPSYVETYKNADGWSKYASKIFSGIGLCDFSEFDEEKYDGNAHTPEFTVSYGKEFVIILEKDRDYEVEYTDNVDAGTATVTVTGIGNYYGTKVLYFTIAKRTLELTSGSDSKVYDGTPLMNNKITVTGDGFIEGEGLIYNPTGLQKDVGSTANTFTYVFKEGTKEGNYDVTVTEGELTVTKRSVIMTSETVSSTYNGMPLYSSTITVTGDGFADNEGSFYIDFGSQTDAGTSDNRFTYILYDSTKAENYEISVMFGELTVEKRIVTIRSATDTKAYDSTALTNSTVVADFAKGEGADYTFTGTQTDVGTSKNTFTYVLKSNTKESNYILKKEEGDLTVTKRTVFLTSASETKIYDGESLTNNEVVVSGDGFIDGQGADYTVTGTLTEAGTVKNSFSYELRSGTDAKNYEITTIEGDLTVSKRNVVITSAYGTKVYDGEPLTDSSITISGDGFLGSDGVICTVSGTQTEAGTSPNEFTYELKVGTKAGNYNISAVEGELTVTQRPVIVTADNKTKVYGTSDPDLSASVEGLIEPDEIIYSLSRVEGEDVGAYTIMLSGETSQGNYSVKFFNATLTVEPKEITEEMAGEIPSIKYDGTEQRPKVTVTCEGILLTTDIDYTVTYTDNIDAGQAKAKIEGKGNYSNDFVVEFTITKRNVTITSASAEKVYNGSPLTKSNVVITSDGFITGEGATYVFTGTQTDAGKSENKFTYELNGITKSRNYVITTVNGELNVTPRNITVNDTAAEDKTYDGNVSATITHGTVEGIVDGDVISVEVESAKFSDKNVSMDDGKIVEKVVTVIYKIAGDKKGNYTVGEYSVSAKIIPAKVDVIGLTADDKTYDGKLDANASFERLDGRLEGDEFYAEISSATFEDKDAGTEKTVQVGFQISGKDAINYGLSYILPKANISPRIVILTSASDSRVYNGTPLTNSKISESESGFITGEGATYSVTGSQFVAGTSKNTFEYTLKEGTKTDNYAITKIEGTLTVRMIDDVITITADSASKKYDGKVLTVSTFTSTEDVLVDGDVLTADIVGSIKDVGTVENTVVSYKIMHSDTDVTCCYSTVKLAKGALEITKRSVTLTSASDSRPYDGTVLKNGEVGVSGDGFVTGEGATYSVTGSQFIAGSSANTFTYTLKDGTKTDNYAITKVEGTLTVKRISSEITITADSDSKMYDGKALTKDSFTSTKGVIVSGDELTAVISGTITDFGTADNVVKSFKVMHNDIDVTDCYTFTDPVNGTLEITKRSVTMTSASDSKTYDGTALKNGKVTESGDGFVTGEGAVFTVTGSQFIAGTSSNVFSYTLNDGTKADNYAITKVEGTLTVTPIASKITITADSTSKMYDGATLTKDTFTYTDSVLVAGDVLTAVISGSITDAGTADNVVTSYSIKHGDVDVTSCYPSVEKVYGTLTITKRSVTLTSASDNKIYDGTALKNGKVTESGDGFVTGEGATYSVTGSQFVAGSSINSFTYTLNEGTKTENYVIMKEEGTLTVERISKAITITADSDSKMYDGKALTKDSFTSTKGVIVSGDELTAVISGTITDFGTADNVVKSFKVMHNDIDVTDCYTFTSSVNGTLEITKRSVTMTSASDSKIYDGATLTNDKVDESGNGFVGSEGATYIVTGSQFIAGSSANTFTYTLKDGTKADNYVITKEEGTLTVKRISSEITITADSDSKMYDGKALTKDSFTSTKDVIISGDELTAVISGTITDFGTADNVVTSFKVMHNDIDVTDCYTFTDPVKGILEITKRSVTMTSASDSRPYDGTVLKNGEVGVSGDGFVTGEGATYSVIGSQFIAGSSANLFTYTLKDGTKADNYVITKEEGTLTVKRISSEITITADSDSKIYDGKALTKDSFTSTKGVIVSGDELTAVISGTITDFGTADNVVKSYKVMHNDIDVTNCYTFTDPLKGVLEITKRSVTMTSASDSKVYDGMPLSNSTVTVSGDGFVIGEGATYSVTGSQFIAGTSSNMFSYTLNDGTKADNYTITKVEGTLTITPITSNITITADSDSKMYDGKALTKDSFTFTKGVIISGDELTAVISGTITDFGTADNVVKSFKVMHNDIDVTDCYTFTDPVKGILDITKRSVTMTSASESKVYDGMPLSNSTVTVSGDGFVIGEGATYSVTGSQFIAGTSSNVFSYTLNDGTKTNNYAITKVEGTLTVTPITSNITITADSDSKMYDGEALTKGTFTYTDGILASGDVLTADIVGKITDVGTSDNIVTGYKIMHDDIDVTDCYSNVVIVRGTLEITKRLVTLTSASDSKVYDGTPLTNATVTVSGDGFITGEGASYDVTGSQTSAGSSKNTFTYTLNESTSAVNYDIQTVEGDLTVEKAEQTITISKNSSCPAGFNLGAKANEDASLSYSVTTGSDIISVDGKGNIVGKAVGNAKLEIKAAATDNYKAGAKTFDISIYDHIHVIVPGVAPTKTEAGLTEGEECSECHKIFTEQKRIEPTGSDKTVIETKDTKAVFEVPDSEEIRTLTVKLEENGSKYRIELNEASTDQVKDTTISFSIKAVEGKSDTYSMITVSDEKEFSGQMKVTLPYDPSKGTPSVKWIEGDQRMDTIAINADEKTVTFSTTHNSTYAVEYQQNSIGVSFGLIAIGILAAIILLAHFMTGRKQ